MRANVFSLMSFRKSITGLAVVNDSLLDDTDKAEGGAATKRCILMCTSHALFCFTGEGDLTTIMEQYDSSQSVLMALAIELSSGAVSGDIVS